MADVVSQTNQGIVSYFTNFDFLNVVGWLIFGVIIVGFVFYGITEYNNKRLFGKEVRIFDKVGIYNEHIANDVAKTVKLGKGSFEILYLKKQKTWKLAYGGRAGRNIYYFFIMGDGYWYNGLFSANIYWIDKEKGLIPVITTNPTMRAQYTSLEKQIDSLYTTKTSFMEKYGVMLFSIGFLVIAGLFLYLNYKQFVTVSGNLNSAIDKMGVLMEKLGNLAGNVQGAEGAGGLKPV